MQRKEPKEIVKKYLENDKNISKTSRDLNISRNTVKKWVKESRSPDGYNVRYRYRFLKRGSTKPKKISHKLSLDNELKLVGIRKEFKYDQVKIREIFFNRYNIKLSSKTVYNVIKRRAPELIKAKPKYRRPRFQNGNHMRPSNTKEPGYIQADVKHVTPELGGLFFTCYEFAFIDIYSRYKVAWIMPNIDEEAAITALRYMLKVMPCKVKYIQTDNGWEFGKKYHEECLKQRIEHYYIHKSSPNENAVIERSFRTDQDEFFYWLDKRPKDINELNLWFQKYLDKYNTYRPHLSLNLQTPLAVIQSFNRGGQYVITD